MSQLTKSYSFSIIILVFLYLFSHLKFIKTIILGSTSFFTFIYFLHKDDFPKNLNLANGVTLFRFSGILITLVFFNMTFISIFLVLNLGLDRVDGYLANKFNTVTSEGSIFDAETDSIVIFFSIIKLVELGIFEVWTLVVIPLRPLFVIIGLDKFVDHRRDVIRAKVIGVLLNLVIIFYFVSEFDSATPIIIVIILVFYSFIVDFLELARYSPTS